MFKLSKKTEYGILALQHMAAMDNGRVTTVKEMSENYKIPHSLLAKICQQLAKSEIISSIQGSRGGYALSRGATDISLADVMEAIEGPIHIVDCNLDHHTCGRDEDCTLKTGLNTIEAQMANFLNKITLQDFAVTSY
jgi:Rrf2 family protein